MNYADHFANGFSRRRFVHALGAGAASLWLTPGLYAEELARTPAQTEGPFYPDKLPLDTDNDLLIVNDKITPAVGEITHLTGRVLDVNGNPISGAVVEIWQVDGRGNYLHSQGATDEAKRDANFQGFGRFMADRKGQYYFRTVKPVAYPGRAPHIHVMVKHRDKKLLTTQMYVKGEAGNARDGIYRSIRDPKQLANVTVAFNPIEKAKGELAANFDIVLGMTPAEKN